MAQLPEGEANAYFQGYIALAGNESIVVELQKSAATLLQTLAVVDEQKAGFRYAPEKWSIKELLAHIVDTERIFANRALRIARGDQTPMPGFDENAYAAHSNADYRALASHIEEFKAVRAATLAFFDGIGPETELLTGTANGSVLSVRAIGYLLCGHELHHNRILKERYL